jgi:hypothetical protein
MNFLFPHIRVELLIRTMLTREWDDEAWPIVREEFKRAMLCGAGYGGLGGGTDAPVTRARAAAELRIDWGAASR